MLDLQALLQTLTANGTPVVIVAVGIPMPGPAQMLTAPMGTGQVTLAAASVTAPGVGTPPPPAPPAPPVAPGATAGQPSGRQTPLQRLRADEQRNGQQRRQPKEWGKLLKMSARELDRALKASAIPHEVEQDGRGHGARLIKTADLRTYLETMAAVAAGRMDAPAWYTEVRPTS